MIEETMPIALNERTIRRALGDEGYDAYVVWRDLVIDQSTTEDAEQEAWDTLAPYLNKVTGNLVIRYDEKD